MARTPIDTKKKTFIYSLSDPDTNEIRYIGKTVKSLNNRLTGHIYTSKKKNNYRCNWIKSIINKGKRPIIEIIDICEWNQSQQLEEYWIFQFKSWEFNLVNATNGGEGNLGLKLSKERLDKLIKANSKKVYQYDLQGNFIQEFNSCQEAANYLNIKSNTKIAACARGVRKSCKKFQWSYEKHDNIGEIKPNRQIGKKLNKSQRDMAVKNLIGYGKYFR